MFTRLDRPAFLYRLVAVLGVLVVLAALSASNVRGYHGSLCWWAEGFGRYNEASGSPHGWTHHSNWQTWSNPNDYLARRLYDATVTYERYVSANPNYHEFTNGSNNWRRTTMHIFQTPYNPGTNWRWEQRSTIGC